MEMDTKPMVTFSFYLFITAKTCQNKSCLMFKNELKKIHFLCLF